MAEHLRIHIVPVGYDSTRITEHLIRKKADRVYFVRHAKDKKSPYFDFIKNELKTKMKTLEAEEVFVNIWDLYDCLEKFRKIVSKEKGNHIYVNVSTGSKITSIAGMLTSMLFENVEPYYVQITYQSSKTTKTIQKEKVCDDITLPVFGITKPPTEYLTILDLLNNQGKMKKYELIDELEDKQIIKQKDEEIEVFSDHAKHSQLRSILNPMEKNWDFIKIEGKGKRSRVEITNQGKYALRIFGL